MHSNRRDFLAHTLAVPALAALGAHRLAAAAPAVASLMGAAAANLLDRDPADALTGPVVRGDAATIARHLGALEANAETLAIYRAVSKAAIPLAKQAGTEARLLAEIEKLLGDPRTL